MSTTRHHSIDYVEFTMTDLPEAKAFYTACFGWSFSDYGPGYCGIQKPGSELEAGGFTQGQPVAGGPLVVLYSSKLDATLAAVKAAGGTIEKAPFDFPGGRRFEFSDPSGNRLAVWTTN